MLHSGLSIIRIGEREIDDFRASLCFDFGGGDSILLLNFVLRCVAASLSLDDIGEYFAFWGLEGC